MIFTKKVSEWFKRIPQHYKDAFFYALLFGIIVHFYMMTNKLTNHDDIEQLYNKMDLKTSGRWFLEYAGSIGSYFSMPWVNGSLIIFYLAVSNALVVGIFEIKDRVLIILISALTMSITTLVALFVFLNSADAYYFAYLISVLGAYLFIKNKKYGRLAFVILNIFSLAIYQIFFGISISIVFIYYIIEFINGKENRNKVLKKYILLTLYSLIAIFGYVISIKYIFNIQLSSYKGIDKIGRLDLNYLPTSIVKAYSEMYKFFFMDSFSQFEYIKYLNYPLFIMFFVMYGFIVNKKLKSKEDKLISILLLLLSPLAINFIYLASGNTLVDLRMLGAYICVYIFIIVLLKNIVVEIEQYRSVAKKTLIRFSWLVSIIIILTAGRFYIVTNKVYMTLDIDSRNMESYTTRVLTRIEEKDYYSKNKEVVFVGLPDISNDFTDSYTTDDVYAVTFFRRKIPSRWHWTLYPKRYTAFPNDIKYFEKSDYDNNTDMVLEELIDRADTFPKQNSIFEYENKIYVKFVKY